MGRKLSLAAMVIALSMAASAAWAADDGCHLRGVAEFKVTMVGMRPTIDAQINGKPIRMLVDSGAFFSVIDAEAAQRLGIRGRELEGMQVRGVGGAARMKVGKADTFSVGTLSLNSTEFLIGGGSAGAGPGGIEGILGRNIVGVADTEYDLANGVVRMFKPDGCNKASLAYWAQDKPYSVLSVEPISRVNSKIVATVKVNGQSMRAVMDTGASTSVLKDSAAAKTGFRKDAAEVRSGGLGGGIGSRLSESWIAPFASFEVGEEKISNTRLRVASIELPQAEMLLGADFFLSHRVYVSATQDKVYFTYNGGPVFRLEAPATGPRGVIAAEAAAAKSPTADGAGLDANGYHRRAAASVARRDFAAGILDYGKAIELEPNEPSHYFARAQALIANRQLPRAMSDLDETLKLSPGHAQALLTRGDIRLTRGNAEGAKLDYQAALLAQDDDSVRVRVGSSLLRAGLVDDAIAEYDAWLAAHGRESGAADVYNARCFARGLANRDLDKALSDCNAAMSERSRNSAFLDSRGLIQYRMGRYDRAIADFDEALRRQPKAANPMYLRGLTKVKTGQVDAGRAEMQAALAIDPSLQQLANRYGLKE